MMDSHKQQMFPLLSLFLLLLLSGERVLQAEARLKHNQLNFYRPKKLFVFGDSYVDTGNTRKGFANSWKDPYGMTFPGKPTGRCSDGRVLTDYIAKYLGVKSPVPYRLRKLLPQHLKYGMNFAVGGTGVFDTWVPGPNMTTQIDLFQRLLQDEVFTASDLRNSVAFVSVAGNDYSRYMAINGSLQGLPSFTVTVINQTATNLLRIKGLGVKKIAVGGLQPLGCLPQNTALFSFQHCNSTYNTLVMLHNTFLNQAITRLNQENKQDHSSFVILDLYNSFMSVLNQPSANNIQNQFTPCCVGLSSEYSCGSVDANNVKRYKVCDNPNSSFFWDFVHPTEAGWHAVYDKLRSTSALQQLGY